MINETVLVERNRIAEAFIARCGDPSQWIYKGECGESKTPLKCVCGHPIKMLFTIYSPDGLDSAIIGSTCIDHYAAYSPENAERMRQALKAFLEAKKEQERQNKAMQQEAEIVAKCEEYAKVRERVLGQWEYRIQQQVRVGWYWYAVVTKSPKPDRLDRIGASYKTKRGFLKWLNDKIKYIQEAPERAAQYKEYAQ